MYLSQWELWSPFKVFSLWPVCLGMCPELDSTRLGDSDRSPQPVTRGLLEAGLWLFRSDAQNATGGAHMAFGHMGFNSVGVQLGFSARPGITVPPL